MARLALISPLRLARSGAGRAASLSTGLPLAVLEVALGHGWYRVLVRPASAPPPAPAGGRSRWA